ncbi:transglycosylase SLT domain-containing protein [Adhaeribacter pallidiroseus]|nr:transglycosylase SLT domain-containing protein [Adhaeribacter pallidiroseus]
MLKTSYYTPTASSANKEKLDSIEREFGQTIRMVADLTKVPYELILTTIFLESAGNKNTVSGGGALGLMQITLPTALDALVRENVKKRLGAGEIELLRNVLGTRLNNILAVKGIGGLPAGPGFIKSDLLNHVEVNILMGAIYLGQLLDEQKEGSTYRLDKVIARYNMGYYAFNKGKSLVGTAAQLVAKLPKEPSAYIQKLVGVNGVLLHYA